MDKTMARLDGNLHSAGGSRGEGLRNVIQLLSYGNPDLDKYI